MRLTSGGDVDTGFNPGGIGANGAVSALALQPDGKVLVGGQFTGYNGSTAAPDRVLRLNATGSLDAGFNAGGSGPNGLVFALALQPDGKVLVGGGFTTYNGTAATAYLLRLSASGTPDAAFNAGGSGANNYVRAVAVQPDGKVLAGGEFTAYNGNLAAPDALLRLNPDGGLNDGTQTGLAYTWNNGATGPSIVVSQPGDYVATANGTAFSNVVRVNAPPAVAVQLTPAGPLALPAGGSATLTASATRPGFNVQGSGFGGPVYAVALQPDGKVLVGGDFTAYNGNAAAPDNVLRLNADGSLDASFNGGGAGANGIVRAVATTPDGKVVIGGIFTGYNGNAAAPDRVLRLNADGSLDASFNSGGSGTDDYVYALAVQPNGKVLVGGSYSTFNGSTAAPRRVLRLNANGSLDASFNPGGSGADGIVWSLALQPDGKVLVGGTSASYNGNANTPHFVMRLTAEGALDQSFNAGGAGTSSVVYALAVQPDGKVLAGGTFTAYNGNLAAPDQILRLNADGSLDAGFNAGGTGANSYLLAVAVQPDGKVLIGGNFSAYNGDFAAPDRVLRLNADGTLDNTFNNGGAGANNLVHALALQGNGQLVIGAYSMPTTAMPRPRISCCASTPTAAPTTRPRPCRAPPSSSAPATPPAPAASWLRAAPTRPRPPTRPLAAPPRPTP
ncbi:hypothetical protein MUN81_22620 (plasmid) [Hymenobacter sp. 5317J-9]|uniref:hypothetical protein n=1 Tax=Hymenobacter sp. 5317J-9 TaxID=2932250 RepID=UPI001FD6BC58|nr:hypothetical protein [Hymenobacter sp. 5317J-9]UOR00199.1 hypothetical protein MUN81_22620 [Hymenobacter sp. 5317J-9]